jgi:hypothetical protein
MGSSCSENEKIKTTMGWNEFMHFARILSLSMERYMFRQLCESTTRFVINQNRNKNLAISIFLWMLDLLAV